MLKYLLILLLFVTAAETSVTAQSYYFRHYQVENGLSNNTVFCCAQDRRGFMWMGTKDGLNRFDGYSFKVFRNDADDSLSIGDNFIRSLYIDGSDVLYAGTRNGLYRYNASKENFSLVFKTSGEIRDIKKDRKGNCWFVAGQVLIKYNEQNKISSFFKPDLHFSATSVCVTGNDVWIATANGTLQRYNEVSNTFTAYDIFDGTQLSSKWIEKIYATKDGNILAGTSNYGVKLFNVGSLTCKNLLTYNPDKTEIFARDFVQTSPYECWMATESGIFIYNLHNNTFVNLQKKYNNPYSITDNAVYCLSSDKEGGIWAGTYFGGANYYPKQYNAFEKYFPDYNNESLSGNAVREICEDKYGDLWIGTEDAGLNRLNKNTRLFTQYKPTGFSTGIAYPNIHGLLAKGDELWIGTFEHGLDIMNIKTGKVIKHYPGDDSSKALRSNFIVTILQTKSGGIFIGTRQGLYRFNGLHKNFDNIAQIPANSFIHSLLEDSDGSIWVGTMGSGLFRYDAGKDKAVNFSNTPGNRHSISSNSITTIFQDSNGERWFGTEGGGLCKLIAGADSFINYTSKDGFPGNSIFKMLEDSRKNLWITTSKGLVCFSPATKKIHIYTTANGLLSDQFNYNSGYKDRDGNMYFGSVKGLISFNPDHFVTNTFTPPVYITDVQSNNKELAAGIIGSSTRAIELAYDQSTFSIDFAALSFTAPEMTEYQYIMEGLDNNWTYLKTNRKVYFTDLSPGNYVFKVKAANSSGVWNPAAAVLKIKVLPPFWKSVWAYLIYSIAIGLIIYYLFNAYHKRQNEKTKRRIELLEHEKEKEIYDAKIDFFTNIAHEIKTPLTLIKAPMEKIMMKAGDNPDIGQHLKIVEKNTGKLVELTTQLLDFRRAETKGFHLNYEKININEMLAERHSSFSLLAEQKDINFKIILPAAPLIAQADPDSLQKIVNNLFSNALNYCNRKVEVELFTANNDNFSIEFRNDGQLIPGEMEEKIFEPFFRLHAAKDKAGSGIGLALSRSLAELHKGKIYLKQNSIGMNIFVLTMPVEHAVKKN